MVVSFVSGVSFTDLNSQLYTSTGALSVGSGLSLNGRTVAASDTVLTSDGVVNVAGASAAVVLTLPDAADCASQMFFFKDKDGASGTYNITITPVNAQTIDGASTKVINIAYGALLIRSNGALWQADASYNQEVTIAGTPVNAVAATQTLIVSGLPIEDDTVTIGSRTYRFLSAIEGLTAATGTLSISSTPSEAETVTIGSKTYKWRAAIGAGTKASAALSYGNNAQTNETVTLGSKTYTYVDALTEAKATGRLSWSDIAENGAQVTIGAKTYTFKTALTEANATGTLTASANALPGETVTIGGTVYTFRAVVSSAYDVFIGLALTNSLDNLVAAITHDTGEGTLYGTGTVAHPTVTAMRSSSTMVVTALAIGTAGNVASTETSISMSWGASTLTGGTNAIVNEVLRGGSTSQGRSNLAAAITHGANEGVKYSTGTTANASVTAVSSGGFDAVDVTALAVGTAGNSIATTVASTSNLSFAGATLSGGVASIANEVLLGGGREASIDNLVAAVNGAAGSGTTYATATVASTQIDAVKTNSTTFGATAKSVGFAGNAYASTTVSTFMSFGGSTFSGGVDAQAANDVLINGTTSSCTNLVAAIGAGSGSGTTYGTGTTASTQVTAVRSFDTVQLTAITAGQGGNSIATTETMANGSFNHTTLTGGEVAEGAGDVLIGVSASATIDNLVLAITAGSGAGTNYGDGTTAHPTVTAVKTDSSTMTITALTKGAAANSIALSESATNIAWTGSTPTGGINGTLGTISTKYIDSSYYYKAIATNTVSDTNWRRFAVGSAY